MTLIVIAATLLFNKANAAANCSGPTTSSFTFPVPSGTYTIPRGVPVGTILTPWTSWMGAPNGLWVCSFYGRVPIAPRFKTAYSGPDIILINSPSNVPEKTFTVYPTNLKGVGVAMLASATTPPTPSPGTFIVPIVSSYWEAAGGIVGEADGYNAPFGFYLKFAFVKTGPMDSGLAIASGPAMDIGMDHDPATVPSNAVRVNFSGSATFQVLACTTPDVTVRLGNWRNRDFMGPGYTTNAVPFNITLSACPAGIRSVKYRIDPLTAVINQSGAIVALDAGGAQGVGIQLLENNGTTVFPLSTIKVENGYNVDRSGNYVIPLKARYYQYLPSTQVKPGPANASMTFTLFYE